MDISALFERFRMGPRDLVGIDLGTSATKAAHLRRVNDGLTLVGAQLLPPLAGLPNVPDEAETVNRVALSGAARSRNAALAISGHNAVIKLVSFPGPPVGDLMRRLPHDMGLKTPEAYRISYQVITEGRGRGESRVLAVGIPDADADAVMAKFASGLPAPYALEISALAAVTAFQHACADVLKREAVGLVEFGDTVTTLCILNNGAPVLVRRFEFGSRSLILRICKNLGVTETIARSIVSDGSFDISEITTELLSPVIAQIIVSRDFIERRENCRLGAMYASGGLMMSADARRLLESRLDTGIRQWNPFDAVAAVPDPQQGGIEPDSAWRFAGAIGAALGVMEEP